MSISFEDFWNELTSHELWFEQMKMRFYQKDLKGTANDCYIFLLASEARWKAQDYQDFRRCYQQFLTRAKDVPVKPQLQQTAEVKKEEPQEPILTGEHREARIKEWLELVREIPAMTSSIPKLTYKEIADEGDWLPKKPAPYPSAPVALLIEEELKIEYARECTDIYTGRIKPGMPTFEDWLKDKL